MFFSYLHHDTKHINIKLNDLARIVRTWLNETNYGGKSDGTGQNRSHISEPSVAAPKNPQFISVLVDEFALMIFYLIIVEGSAKMVRSATFGLGDFTL